MQNKKFVVYIFILLMMLWTSSALAQIARLNIGYGAIGADQLPAWLAQDAGLLEKNGIDGRLIFFTGGSTAMIALISGDVPIAQVAGPGLVNSVLAGSDAVYVAGGMTSLNYQLVGRAGVASPDQLKNGTVAISRFGSATDTIARFALRQIGLTPGKDVMIVQIGSGPDRLNAALTGRVTAAVINPPTSFVAENKGLKVIADVAQMGLVFQHTGIVTTRRFIKERPDVVRAYVRAHVEAVSRIWLDKEASIKALAKYMGKDLDRTVLEKSRENILTETLMPKKQYPSLEGLRTVLEDAAERDPRAKTAKPEQFVDSTFIRELDQSGFIDSLYKKR